MIRQDGNNEGAVLQRLITKRVDVTMIQQSALDYMFRNDSEIRALQNDLHIPEFKSFMLQAMLPSSRPDLETVLSEATKSEEWKQLFEKYQINI